MVFFHSYVSLPEGRWFSELFYKPQLSSGMTDWNFLDSDPNLGMIVPFKSQFMEECPIQSPSYRQFSWIFHISNDSPIFPMILSHMSNQIIHYYLYIHWYSHIFTKKKYPIYFHLISPYFNSQILPKKVRLDPLGMIPSFFAQFPSPIFGIHQIIVIFCWLWSFYPIFQLYE